MIVPSFSVNIEKLKDGSIITNFGNRQVCFSKLSGFFSSKVGILIIAMEGILFQNCKTPNFETWATDCDVIMTSSCLKNSFPALKKWTITAIKSNSKFSSGTIDIISSSFHNVTVPEFLGIFLDFFHQFFYQEDIFLKKTNTCSKEHSYLFPNNLNAFKVNKNNNIQ